MGNDLKYSRLHAVFGTILKSFIDAQAENALNNVTIKFGQKIKKVNLKLPCFYIIGDMQGALTCGIPGGGGGTPGTTSISGSIKEP